VESTRCPAKFLSVIVNAKELSSKKGIARLRDEAAVLELFYTPGFFMHHNHQGSTLQEIRDQNLKRYNKRMLMESKEARRLEKLATGTIININNEYQISNAKYPENECLTPPVDLETITLNLKPFRARSVAMVVNKMFRFSLRKPCLPFVMWECRRREKPKLEDRCRAYFWTSIVNFGDLQGTTEREKCKDERGFHVFESDRNYNLQHNHDQSDAEMLALEIREKILDANHAEVWSEGSQTYKHIVRESVANLDEQTKAKVLSLIPTESFFRQKRLNLRYQVPGWLPRTKQPGYKPKDARKRVKTRRKQKDPFEFLQEPPSPPSDTKSTLI